MNFYKFLISLIALYVFIPFLSKAGLPKPYNIYMISIGFSNEGPSNKNISSDKIFVAANQACPACLSDATGLPAYLQTLGTKHSGSIDSVFTFQYIHNDINIDTIYKAFLTVQKRAKETDVFVFYYASASWGTKYNSDLVANEGYYVLNKKYDRIGEIDKFSFTLRQLKALTDRIASQRQLIIFDSGHGNVIEADYYRNFFSDNPIVANFTKKNRIIICPEFVSAESLDPKDNVMKGDLFKVISNLSDTLNVFTLFDTSMKSRVEQKSIYKEFMKSWYEQQLNCLAQIKILKELDYINILTAIKPISSSADRGIIVGSHENKKLIDSSFLSRKKKVLIVATNMYESPMWPSLRNPINDGKAIAEVLGKAYGYDVTILNNTPKDTILQALDAICTDKKNPYSQYIIYFAGHGFYDESQHEGFIVCKDSKEVSLENPKSVTLGTYISYTTILNKINYSLNKVLFITDVCFGGTSFNSVLNINSTVEPSDEKGLTKNPFKKVLASGITNVPDGKSENSPFALTLLDILRNNKSNLNYTELISGIEKKKLTPRPVEDNFGTTKKPNEFIF